MYRYLEVKCTIATHEEMYDKYIFNRPEQILHYNTYIYREYIWLLNIFILTIKYPATVAKLNQGK